MHAESGREDSPECTCPCCALWSAYRKSEAAKHLRGIQREGLLLVRSLLDACISKADEHLSGKAAKAEDRK